jgi:N-acetylglucosaminyl-diphospho-decaprenol L-rhamnosyltransferase
VTVSPIGIVVVNFAAADLLRETLVPLGRAHAKIVVVDNFSNDTERDKITALTAEQGWQLVPMADNRGFGPGVNAGVTRARALGCHCFLLLNPDVASTPEVVEQLRLASLASPLALISPRLIDRDGTVSFVGASLDLMTGRTSGAEKASQGRTRCVRWITATCLAVHQELWQRTGGMAADYFMYWEDVDFSVRSVQAGGALLVRDDLTVVHDQGGTQGPRRGRAKSSLYYFYNARNRMLFATRHLGKRALWSWWWRTPKVSWEILLRGGRRQLLHSPQLALAAGRGACAGMAIGARALLRDRAGSQGPVPPTRPGKWIPRRGRSRHERQSERQDQHFEPAVRRGEKDVPHRQRRDKD